MKSNLIPKQITDKNGVISMRWVKPEQQGLGASSPIPAPATVPQVEEVPAPSDELVMEAALAYTKQVTYDDDDEEYVDDLLNTTIEDFSTYPASVLNDLMQRNSNQYGKAWGFKNLRDHNFSQEEMRDYLNLYSYCNDNAIEGDSELEYFIPGVANSYPGLEPITLVGDYPERRKQQIKGLIGVTSRIRELSLDEKVDSSLLELHEAHDVSVITDKRLVNLLIERPEDNARILEFMDERETADYDRIIEMLDSKTPAIASGEL